LKNKLHHPLWTHLPAVAALIFVIVYTIVSGPLPSHVATHFSFSGEPNDYGTPFSIFGVILGLSILFLVTSGIIDEIYARQEKKKTFNWFCLMDELFGGLISGIYFVHIQYIKSGSDLFLFNWPPVCILAGSIIFLAIILEFIRPFRPQLRQSAFGSTDLLEKELEKNLNNDTTFIYWQSQNPFWVSVISIGMPVVLITVGVITVFSIWWVGLIVVVSGLSVIMLYGGLRTSVTKDSVIVRFGTPGFRVLNLKTADIINVELKEFSPIADFGGYGIRFNKEMQAFYMRGSRGVKFTTKKGTKYLIGSDNPEELYAVVQTVVKGSKG
jgi:hypothetical protein